MTLDVPTTVVRFDQVKVGDRITATYYDWVNVRLKPAGEAAVDRIVEPTTAPTPGALPGATIARQRIATATITGWDPTNRMISFTGPKGVTRSTAGWASSRQASATGPARGARRCSTS
jgi:hypothetical protein